MTIEKPPHQTQVITTNKVYKKTRNSLEEALNNLIFDVHVDAIFTYDSDISGWVQLDDGEIFCVAHYRGDAKLSYVTGTWIRESDFTEDN